MSHDADKSTKIRQLRFRAVLLLVAGGLSAVTFLGCARAEDKRSLDPSIAGISLLDPDSTTEVLGQQPRLDHEEFGTAYYRYVNETRTVAITLIQHPGDRRFSIAEVRVAPALEGVDLPVFPMNEETFVTANGISLGMSRQRVKDLLGAPQQESELAMSYRLEAPAPILQPYKMPLYEATYVFEQGILTEFRFGFGYP